VAIVRVLLALERLLEHLLEPAPRSDRAGQCRASQPSVLRWLLHSIQN
jgi:hypothetical protein